MGFSITNHLFWGFNDDHLKNDLICSGACTACLTASDLAEVFLWRGDAKNIRKRLMLDDGGEDDDGDDNDDDHQPNLIPFMAHI